MTRKCYTLTSYIFILLHAEFYKQRKLWIANVHKILMMENFKDTRYFKLKVLTTLINNNLSRDKSPLLAVAFKTLPQNFNRSDISTICATQNILFSLFLKNDLLHRKMKWAKPTKIAKWQVRYNLFLHFKIFLLLPVLRWSLFKNTEIKYHWCINRLH